MEKVFITLVPGLSLGETFLMSFLFCMNGSFYFLNI